VRQLLGHLGGIRHYKGDEQFPQVHCSSVTESLGLFANDPLENEPGTQYLYSTYGYSLLGAAIQRVAQQEYAAYMQEHIFRPVGMNAIQIDDITQSDPYLAEGYYHNNSGSLQQIRSYDTTCRLPGGGFRSPIGDVTRFVLAMMDDRLLKAKTREAMWTPQRTKSGETVPYGMGWQVEEWNGQRVAFHNGAQPGVVTTIWMLSERKFAVILLANLHEANLAPLSPKIAEIVLQESNKR
jgi:serine beta-lactamase-like protein LACTB, mitochondrial